MQFRYSAALLLFLAACSSPKATPPAGPQEVVFTATDFAFSGPDSITPGPTAIRLVNHGAQPHHMIMGLLDADKSIADLMAFVQKDPTAEPPFVSWRGAAGAVMPGDSAGSTADLVPGHYILICFFTDPADNRVHAAKGMVKELVVAGTPHAGQSPEAEAEIRLKDYAFTTPAFAEGTHTFHIVNDGPKTHEVQLIRVNDGVTVQQFLAALSPGAKGPPPGTFAGGSGALSTGRDNYWTVTFDPGTYVLICFVPDSGGMPHAMKGMVHDFTIPAS